MSAYERVIYCCPQPTKTCPLSQKKQFQQRQLERLTRAEMSIAGRITNILTI